MKKLLLGLGTLAAVAAPVAAVVACSSNGGNIEYEYVSTSGIKTTVKLREDGYSISAKYSWSDSGVNNHYEQKVEEIYSKKDIADMNKLEKLNFLIDNYDGDGAFTKEEAKRKFVDLLNSDGVTFKSRLVFNEYTLTAKPDGRTEEVVLGTGKESLVKIIGTPDGKILANKDKKPLENYIISTDPEIKSLTGLIILDDSMSEKQLAKAIKPMVDINKVFDEYNTSHVSYSEFGDRIKEVERNSSFIVIYNNQYEKINLYSRYAYATWGKLNEFESKVNDMVSKISGNSSLKLYER